MFRPVCLALGIALAATSANADIWRAVNQHEVAALKGGGFEVISEVGAGAADYWCGAGDYVRRRLGARGTQRIYISRALGPSVARPGKSSVQFVLTPPPGADTSTRLSLSVKAVGDNLSAAMAQQYCYGDDPFDPFPRRR